MARSFDKHSPISSFLFSLFLCFAVSFCAARTVQIDDICSKHNIPYNCGIILRSIPGLEAGADINSLSLYIINLVHENAFDTMSLIDDLIRNTTDNQLKQRYSSCTMDYNDVLLCLTQAKTSYSSGDFNTMKSNGATIIKDVQHCDSKPPIGPSALQKNNQYLEDVAMIIMILADFLAGKY
ncbi:hypothetical protein RJT34_04120 [Clitoria ternatea]|uniref:Pectinesterase inhibitor domain-containing protein n=1 Tax=Clitoria ternatea TaxID=43366 RepID=A0AAN9Q347_CLITE